MAQTTTMNFFESQDRARRNTFLLTLYYILAVLFIVFGVYAALLIAWSRYDSAFTGLWHPGLFLWAAASVLVIVLMGSIFKIVSLSKGGESVAEMLGAVPVDPNTEDPRLRRLLNVVEEMAIASGVPVPSVFLLNKEKGINAFAAGLTPGNAVVAVTQGCIDRLTRDELQGVIAHEFSHILNGDMRLNIRLMGIIAGILVIGMIGRLIVRGSTSGRSRSSGKKGGGGGVIIIVGLVIMVVGYMGVLFAKLIKSAVSRQREYLADASAVQFTRNPSGIGGALAKIGGLKYGSRIKDVHAEEASHLFFGNGLGKSFLNLLATHPPIEERIHRIDPSFDPGRTALETPVSEPEPLPPGASGFAGPADTVPEEEVRVSLPPEEITSRVGAPQAEHIAFASRLVADLPTAVSEAAREPFGARALIYALLLNKQSEPRKRQVERLDAHADPLVMEQTRILALSVDTIGRAYRLPLVDMALPALRRLSPNQYKAFRLNVKHLAQADEKISLFEYVLQRLVIRHLDPVFRETRPPALKYRRIDQVRDACTALLSVIAWRGSKDSRTAGAAFRRGLEELETGEGAEILPKERCGLKVLDTALDKLAQASPAIKKRVLKACMASISADALITVAEAELLRAVADSLDCPIPPIIPRRL